MVLELKNNLSKELHRFTVTDLKDSQLFYHFWDLEFRDKMVEGQYSYFLYDEDRKIVAEGECQLGTFVEERIKYEKEEKDTFIQYQG